MAHNYDNFGLICEGSENIAIKSTTNSRLRPQHSYLIFLFSEPRQYPQKTYIITKVHGHILLLIAWAYPH